MWQKTKVDKILNCTIYDKSSVLNETVSKSQFKLHKMQIKKFNGEV